MFYENPSVSSRVLKATSAYTWRSKIVTINMDIFRQIQTDDNGHKIGDPRQVHPGSEARLVLQEYCGGNPPVWPQVLL